MKQVKFNYADAAAPFKHKTAIQLFLATVLFKKEKKTLDTLQYVFCSDDYLLQINNQFLKHDFYTDIITFDLSETKATIGEIYISVDRVKENAVTQKTSFQQEMERVIFHGALHLCGYKDKTKSQITTMRQQEAQYLRLFENYKNK
jgi:probable rRNA maturation factor